MELTAQEIALIEGLRKYEIRPSFIVSDAQRFMDERSQGNEYNSNRYVQYSNIAQEIRMAY